MHLLTGSDGMPDLKNKLYITTIADNASTVAEKYGLGLEIAEFCTALNMDTCFAETDKSVREKMRHADRFVFHAPFNELCPAAIDPLVVDITRRRYRQAVETSLQYGIHKIVIHSGFTPLIYYKEWFTEKSVLFWQDFLKEMPEDIAFCYENVMEDSPDMPFEIVSRIHDKRLGLCLDVGHATTVVSNTEAGEWIKKYGSLLNHFHFHSNNGGNDMHLPLGDGIVDFDRILKLALAYAPEATMTIESIDAESSCRWLSQHGYLE